MRSFMSVVYILCVILSVNAWADALSDTELLLVTHKIPPYSWPDEDGVMQGLTVEIADLLFESAGVAKRWRVMPQKRAYNYVKTTPNTCVFPSQRSQEREASYRWVSPILITQYAVFAHQDRSIRVRTLQDMQNYKVVTQLGSGIKEYLVEFGIDVIEVVKPEQAMAMVSLGRSDLWATDILSKVHVQSPSKNDFGQQFIFFTSISAMACNRNVPEALIQHLQAHLSDLYKGQKVSKIVQRYAEVKK